MYKKKWLIILLIFITAYTNVDVKAQGDKRVNALTFEKAAAYYKFWTQELYPLQRALVYSYWKEDGITRIERLPALEYRMKMDMGTHPNYFKLYPKQLEGIIQSQSVDKKNYRTFTNFVIAGDDDTPPEDGKVYLDYYKRYCYWKKLMNDKVDMVIDNAKDAMLEAEKANDDVRAKKLVFMERYVKALKILYPNNPKVEYLLKRTVANSGEANKKVGGVAYYNSKIDTMRRLFRSLHSHTWSEGKIKEIKEFNYPELLKRMNADKAKNPEYFKLYPSMLGNNGMGVITKQTVSAYSKYGVAEADEKPPANADAKKIIEFYKAYCFWRYNMDNSPDLVTNLRTVIVAAEQAHENFIYEKAIFAREYADLSVILCPDNEQIKDLNLEAHEVFKSAVEKLRGLFSGKFHEAHLQQIVVFNKKPNWGQEKDADLIQTIVPGKPAYITGYFTATNSMGIPTMVLLNNNDKLANAVNMWSKALDFAKVPMYNQYNIKKEFGTKAYFTFNIFPDIATTNYESHVQYFPHLNFVKWLIYQPSEVLEFKVKWGRTKKMAEGIIRIDLSGDNKKVLKEYFKKLEAKRLSMVTYPKMNGCTDAKGKITNYTDLSKYGKVLKVTLSSEGNIMMPWPNDHKVDWNTAKGFAAVEKSDGKVIIIPLDFRKKPSAAKWKWWSMGSFPGLYPLTYQGEINAVKKNSGGYEILKKNINKCGTWYTK